MSKRTLALYLDDDVVNRLKALGEFFQAPTTSKFAEELLKDDVQQIEQDLVQQRIVCTEE